MVSKFLSSRPSTSAFFFLHFLALGDSHNTLLYIYMGRFKNLVGTPVAVELFKAKYNIPEGVGIRYCPPENILTDRQTGEVVIPVIAFLEGGMTIPIGTVTRDYLRNHRLCPH